jgi:hypothetical protein
MVCESLRLEANRVITSVCCCCAKRLLLLSLVLEIFQHTPIKIPGQDISKFTTQARELKVELDKLYAYEHTITKKILWNLSQVTVDRFRISVYTLMDQIEPKLQEIKTLSYTDAEFHMIAEHLDLEFILTKYEAMYKSMVTSGEWAPARNKIDKNVPEVNQVEVDKSKKDQEYKSYRQEN